MTKLFKSLAEKYPNKKFLVKNTHISYFGPKFRHFCFSAKFMELDKLYGADIKYDIIVFKFQPKNTKMMHF